MKYEMGKRVSPGNFLTDCQSLIQSKGSPCRDWAMGWTISVQISTNSYPKMTRPNFLYNGYWDTFQDVKRPGRDAGQLPLYSTEVKNEWGYTSTPPYMPSWRGKVHFTFLPFYQANISIYKS